MSALKNFIDISKEEFEKFVCNIDFENLQKAAKIIIEAKENGNNVKAAVARVCDTYVPQN